MIKFSDNDALGFLISLTNDFKSIDRKINRIPEYQKAIEKFSGYMDIDDLKKSITQTIHSLELANANAIYAIDKTKAKKE